MSRLTLPCPYSRAAVSLIGDLTPSSPSFSTLSGVSFKLEGGSSTLRPFGSILVPSDSTFLLLGPALWLSPRPSTSSHTQRKLWSFQLPPLAHPPSGKTPIEDMRHPTGMSIHKESSGQVEDMRHPIDMFIPKESYGQTAYFQLASSNRYVHTRRKLWSDRR